MIGLMFERKMIRNLEDFFVELNKRADRAVYFYRVNGYNEAVRDFICRYYEEARTSGVIIEGRIPNPDEKNLSFYEEMMGMEFQMSTGFIGASLKKWLPRMNDYQRNNVAASIYDTLDAMRREGKNENMLRNAYIKFMCWLYYKFERIVNRIGSQKIPKILYEGSVSNYELKLLAILASAGCDIVLLQYDGDGSYLKFDPQSKLSFELQLPGMGKFPEKFCLKQLRDEMKNRQNMERLYGGKPTYTNCTNAWIEGKGLSDITKEIQARGTDSHVYYNCFCRISGVEDKLLYMNMLYQFRLELKQNHRKLVIVDKEIPQPSPEEINGIHRKNYQNQEQMLMDLSNNIKYHANIELQKLMNRAFMKIMLGEAEKSGMSLNRLTGKAVYLLCWLKRYQAELFGSWRMPEIGCFIHMGGCKNEGEALFLRFLSLLPVDVLILKPDLNTVCFLEDKNLYEIHYPESLAAEKFPGDGAYIQIGTAAYHAERELDTLMYQDSGMYRNQQYGQATAVTLQTMYEEIKILWEQEVKYRPNFSVVGGNVNVPVIFAKASGVKDGELSGYWAGIKMLLTEDTILVKKTPFIDSTEYNPVKAHATEFFKNGRLRKDVIKSHPCYKYGFLREEMQEHILDKLGLLIERRIIKGTFERGVEYTIIATVLNLDKNILRLLQKYDFTKKNPKFIYINTTEEMISLEDSILTAFLNLAGFDVVYFIPTGYQNVEKYFNGDIMEEHQVGEYMYDLRVPDFDTVSLNTGQSWLGKIFKRGS